MIGVSATHSTLADAWGRLPFTFGYSLEPGSFIERIGFREDAPPWRYGWGLGVRLGGRLWFAGWSRRLTAVADEADGSMRMMGGRELLNDAVTIGGWGRDHEQ